MPACKVGCCPGDVCECANDCECLLPGDADLSPGVGFESPFLIAEHNLKGEPDGMRLKFCPCRTKEELAEYVKPIEARLHGDETGGKNDDDLNSTKKQDVSKNTNPDMVDKCCETSDYIGTHASHGHEDKCCDDGTCAETAEKDRGSTHGKTSTGCCDDESCEKECDSPPGNEEHHQHTAAKSCCKDESCQGEGELKIGHQQEKCGTDSCCADKPSKETHKQPKPTGESCCNDKNCETTKSRHEKHKPQDSCCRGCGDEANMSSKKDNNTSSSNSCCEDKSFGESTPSQEPHRHSHTAASCCGQKSCQVPAKETYKHPQCREGKGSKAYQSKTLPRTKSLPTNNVTSNPNSPTRIAKAPNLKIKSNFSLDEVSPAPYRKTRRSQSLAEARLGSLLSERRPSCFQLSTQGLGQGVVPDPHRGHNHHHAHEYHHQSKSCCHCDHGNHDHHHGDHDDGDRDDHDDTHRHGNDSCCQGNDSTDRNNCCEDPKCGDQFPNSNEELKLLMKSKGSRLDVGEMIVRTTKLRVQNLCCPKEGQIVHDELCKLEVCLLNFLRSPLFVFLSACML